MRYFVLIGFFVFSQANLLMAQNPLDKFFQKTDQFLSTHVQNGLVDYRAIVDQKGKLNKLTKQIANAEKPSKASVRKAFYINAYNLLAIKQVVNHYPIESPKDVDGFFNGIKHEVHGKSMTLDELEKETLLKEFPDARVHFAVICAAKGCPPMKAGAYKPSRLDEDLDQQTKRALSDSDFLRFDNEGRIAKVSQIFKWYKDDYLAEANSLLAYINKYREGPLPADTRISFYDYDWSLNQLKKK